MSAATQMNPLASPTPVDSRAWIWVGRSVTMLVVLFSAFDGITKVIQDPHVLSASADLGYSVSSIAGIGALLLASTVLYAIPHTAILGAILVTGYLGGAVASNIRVGHPVFECIFPVIFATLAWGGIFLREPRLRELIPFRRR